MLFKKMFVSEKKVVKTRPPPPPIAQVFLHYPPLLGLGCISVHGLYRAYS